MATAVLRGDVDVMFEFYAAAQGLLDAKKLVGAGLDRRRTHRLPAGRADRQESGLKGFEVNSWNGISVPAATPKARSSIRSARRCGPSFPIAAYKQKPPRWGWR